MRSISVATAQLPITGDPRENGAAVQEAMRTAATGGASLAHFPEGMLSGYAKHQIHDWREVDWASVRHEMSVICELARELGLWVILGSAHMLTPPNWPHNSLYVISDEGRVVDRYDKRFCSHTETTQFYSPGFEPVVVDIGGFKFGCVICVEINFPHLFIEYSRLGVDCVLLSAYPNDSLFVIKSRAHAAIHSCWISLAVPSQTSNLANSSVIGPDGGLLSEVETHQGVAVTVLDRHASEFETSLAKARPWRARVSSDISYYGSRRVDDLRSRDRTCF